MSGERDTTDKAGEVGSDGDCRLAGGVPPKLSARFGGRGWTSGATGPLTTADVLGATTFMEPFGEALPLGMAATFGDFGLALCTGFNAGGVAACTAGKYAVPTFAGGDTAGGGFAAGGGVAAAFTASRGFAAGGGFTAGSTAGGGVALSGCFAFSLDLGTVGDMMLSMQKVYEVCRATEQLNSYGVVQR
jgi:hypothetical protein